ncbi:unnamed protein product [Leptidea sinapis]|uniref:Uncharacterized protein n=1 Tax=Leptidea sinapis TaxID=189913 RepID=A0A5E4PT83_9NEOP|nr:unnamed protein product [Leptidea sinapis]
MAHIVQTPTSLTMVADQQDNRLSLPIVSCMHLTFAIGYCEDESSLRHRCVRAYGELFHRMEWSVRLWRLRPVGGRSAGGCKLRAASAGATTVKSAGPRARRGLDR